MGVALAQSAAPAPEPLALLERARIAAREDRNAESARLFALALGLDPSLQRRYEREYADQLTYSGHASDAVPIYRRVLAREGQGDDAARARRGLALALLWSGQHAAAGLAWDEVRAAAPDDADAAKNLRDALIGAAREAAKADRNVDAADYFGRAAELDPARKDEIWLEYAEQLAYAGRSDPAVVEFRDLLHSVEDMAGNRRAERGQALALLWSGNYEAAIEHWKAILLDDPDDADARQNLMQAYAGAARAAAEENRNRLSADLLALALGMEVDPNPDLELEYAEQLVYSERAQSAVPLLRTFLGRDNLGPDAVRRARRGLALALSWSGDLEASLAEYDKLLLRDPGYREALKGRGWVLLWMDRVAEARDSFEAALAIAPEDEEALRGLAQAQSYLGNQRTASGILSDIIDTASPETRMVAARAALWMGRPDKAYEVLERLIGSSPEYREAGDLIAEINALQRPVSSVTVRASDQSDGLRIDTVDFSQSQMFNRGLTTAGLQFRSITFSPTSGGDVRLTAPGAFLRHRFGDAFELNASVLAGSLDGPGFDHAAISYDAWATYWPGDEVRIDASLGRSYFDDVQSLSANIYMDTIGVSVDYRPLPDLKLTGRVSGGELSDGNSRAFAQVAGERRFRRLGELYAGGKVTYFDFSRPDMSNGYFNPDWYTSVEITTRYERTIGESLQIGGTLSLGYEWQRADTRPIFSAGLRAAYDMGGKVKLVGELSHFDASSLSDGDGFHRTTASANLVYRW